MTAAISLDTGRTRAPGLILLSTLAVGVIDGLFAIAVYVVVLGLTTVPKLFQGIASTLLGASSFSGGARTVGMGVLLHFAVALAWSVVFHVAVQRSRRLRGVLASRYGPLKVAAWFGPLVYVVMSLVAIPAFTHRMPPIDGVWLAVLLGHVPFVGLPIAWIVGRGRVATEA